MSDPDKLPDSIRDLVEAMAKDGLGWEDICIRLKFPWVWRKEVRSIVLKKKVHLLRMAVGK